MKRIWELRRKWAKRPVDGMTLREQLPYAALSAALVLTPVILVFLVESCDRLAPTQAQVKSESPPRRKTKKWVVTKEQKPKSEPQTVRVETLGDSAEREGVSEGGHCTSSDSQTSDDSNGSGGRADRGPGGEHIPEPATSMLLLAGCACLWAKRRRGEG